MLNCENTACSGAVRYGASASNRILSCGSFLRHHFIMAFRLDHPGNKAEHYVWVFHWPIVAVTMYFTFSDVASLQLIFDCLWTLASGESL